MEIELNNGKNNEKKNEKNSLKKKESYKPVEPVRLDSIPEDIEFIRSADVCKLLNISNSTLKNLRTNRAIPFYKIGGTFLYNKAEIMNYLASNYSRRI